jgi:trigger factor
MAQINREQLAPLHERISVTVSPADYTPNYEASLKKYAKSANIPGFRKGMVPAGVVKKMYGASVFTEEVLKAIENELMQYLQQENIAYLGQPLPEDGNDPALFNQNEPKDYSFSFEIGLKPEFAIPDLGSATTTLHVVEATDEMINEEVVRISRRLGKMTEPEVISNDEDVLNVSFQPSYAAGVVAEDAEKKDNSLLLNYFSKTVQEQLKGKKKDDSITIQLSTAFEEKEREWLAGDLGVNKESAEELDKYFLMTITKIAFVEKRAMDADFFKEAIPGKEIETEDAFRSEIKAQIAGYWKHQALHLLEHEIFHCVYDLKEKPQLPSIDSAWRGRDSGVTWEPRYDSDTSVPHYRAIRDDANRIMVFICHNTDLGDGWEREGEDRWYFEEFSIKKAYPLGINIVTYAMTH